MELPHRAESAALTRQVEELAKVRYESPIGSKHVWIDDMSIEDDLTDHPPTDVGKHVQGVAKLGNGSLVLSHSTANLPDTVDGSCDRLSACGGEQPELIVINPYTQEVTGGQQINLTTGSDGYPAGMQAAGNYLAVAVSDVVDDKVTSAGIHFFRAPERMPSGPGDTDVDVVDGALTPVAVTAATPGVNTDGNILKLDHAPFLEQNNQNRVEMVAFTYVRSLQQYVVMPVQNKRLQRVYTSPAPSAANGWTFHWTKHVASGVNYGEAGVAFVNEVDANGDDTRGYVLSLGQSGEEADHRTKYAVQRVRFTANGLSRIGDPVIHDLDRTAGLAGADPGPSFRWGGTAHVNEAGVLEFYAASRREPDLRVKRWRPSPFDHDTYAGDSDDLDSGRRTQHRSFSLGGVRDEDIRTRGRIVKVYVKQETADDSASDEPYVAWEGGMTPVQEDVDSDESWAVALPIVSPASDGTQVYVMEYDPESLDDLIGEVFIPPFDTAPPGVTTRTATLTGDDSEYVVTYEVIAPPVADAGGPYAVDEGGGVVLDASGSEPADRLNDLSVEWDLDGDGTFGETGSAAHRGPETGITPTFSADGLDGPSTHQVSVRVTDPETGLTSAPATADVHVANVAPTITSMGLDDASIDEADQVTVSGTFTDPALGVVSETFTGTSKWSDEVSTPLTVLGDGTFTTSRDFPDDDPSTGTPSDAFVVDVTISDDDGGSDSATSPTLTVHNVAPVITSIASTATFADDVEEGDPVTVSGEFADVGTDTHSATVDWGDGTVTPATVNQATHGGTFTVDHAYTAGGVFDVVVTVTDDDTGTAHESTIAVVIGLGINDGVLQVVGTAGDDNVTVKAKRGLVDAKATFVRPSRRAFQAAHVTAIEVWLREGDDRVDVHQSIRQPATVHAGDGADRVKGGSGPDVLDGGNGPDSLWGRRGADTINGGSGNDRIFGGQHHDTLDGGTGRDRVKQ